MSPGTIRLSRSEYTALAVQTFDTPEIVVTVTRHRGQSRARLHTHDGPYLCLVSRGDFDERGPHQNLSVSSGDVIAHPGCDEHANQFGPATVECINFAPQPSGRLNALFSASITEPDSWTDAHMLQRVRSEVRANDCWTPIALEGLAVEMLKARVRRREARGSPSRRLAGLREFIELESPRIPTLFELATRAGVRPAHLTRLFRAAFGTSPLEHARHRRASWTRARIESTLMSFSRVAVEAGYADHPHMCRDLRRRFGLAPHELRGGSDK